MMIWPALKRTNAYAFNQTMVETRWAKCAYLWDGATNQKYFRGCGSGANDCCEVGCGSAYENKCASGNTCTWADPEVKKGACKQFGGDHEPPQTHSGYQCFYPAVAIGYHEQVPAAEWVGNKSDPSINKLREMCKDRYKYNCIDEATKRPYLDKPGCEYVGKNAESWNMRKHNEVVLDELLLLPDVLKDPAVAIPAVLYTAKGGALARKHALEMAEEIGRVTGLDKEYPGKPIPAIGIYNWHPHPNPFYVEGSPPGPMGPSMVA